MEVMENIKLVLVDTDVWSGRKALSAEDLRLSAGQELPPATLATLGSKLVMDPEKMAVFTRLKAAAHRACLRVGVRFLNAYAIPKDRLTDLMTALAAIQHQFEAAKEEFLAGYQTALNEWIQQNAEWGEIIRRSALDTTEVAGRLKFRTQVIEISPVSGHEEGLKKEVAGLPGQLRKEIEQLAVRTWKESFYGRTEVTQRAIRPLRTMLSKIEGLMFLEPELVALIQSLKASFDAIPAKGVVDGPGLVAAAGILSVLGNIPEAIITVQEPEEMPLFDENEGNSESDDEDAAPEPVQHGVVRPPEVWF